MMTKGLMRGAEDTLQTERGAAMTGIIVAVAIMTIVMTGTIGEGGELDPPVVDEGRDHVPGITITAPQFIKVSDG